MTVLLGMELLAILIFWRWADFSRFKELLPIMLTGSYLRFLEHFIIIDWLKIWKVYGSEEVTLWLPISADVTIWPISCYLFVQAVSNPKRWFLGLLWIPIMLLYLKILVWVDVFSMHKGWHLGHSALLVSVYYALIYLLWHWLRQKSQHFVRLNRTD
jgi:hypothetical protein